MLKLDGYHPPLLLLLHLISKWKTQRSYCKSLVVHGGMSPPTEMNYAITRTTSSPPTMADNVVSAVKPKETMLSSNRGRESFKKRKADKNQHLKDCYSLGLFPNLDLQLSTGNGIFEEASLRHPISKEKMWLVGLWPPANPKEIMNQVLGTLLELRNDDDFIMTSNHMNDDDFISNATAISTDLQPQPSVKFEMQTSAD